ncbi:MAG: DUF3047 domain-containing protein [Balneolia bacterium]|nr:DUF3047 domain-containing protein [Balneolia bacterium]
MKTAFLISILSIILLTDRTDENSETESEAPPYIEAGLFSAYSAKETLPSNWEALTFRGIDRTEYTLYDYDGKTVIRAVSENASSALVRRKAIDPAEFPILRWSWKTEQVFEKGDVTSKDGDDYPVRIYIIFDYDTGNLSLWQRTKIRAARLVHGEIPARAINYVWDTDSEPGTIVPNPYTELVKMVVVESGEEHVGEWVSYEMNVFQDYRNIYGEDPPEIAAVAIMTDTDDTGERAISYFGDLKFYRE